MRRVLVMVHLLVFVLLGCCTAWFLNLTYVLVRVYLTPGNPAYHNPIAAWFLLGFGLVDALIVVIWVMFIGASDHGVR